MFHVSSTYLAGFHPSTFRYYRFSLEIGTQSKIVRHFEIHQGRCFGKKQHKTSKNNQIPSQCGYFGQYVTYNKCRNFFQKNVARIEVTCRNKKIPRNWHIFVASTVRTLIFHILPPKTSLSPHVLLTFLKNCQNYAKLLYTLRLLLQEIFFCRKTKTTRKKYLQYIRNKTKIYYQTCLD